jgi:hypothetical protein
MFRTTCERPTFTPGLLGCIFSLIFHLMSPRPSPLGHTHLTMLDHQLPEVVPIGDFQVVIKLPEEHLILDHSHKEAPWRVGTKHGWKRQTFL